MKRYDDLILKKDGTIEKVTAINLPSGKVKASKISLEEASKHLRDKLGITIHDETEEEK